MSTMRLRHSRIVIGAGIIAAVFVAAAVLTWNSPWQASVSSPAVAVPSQATPPRSATVAALGVVEPRAGLVDLAPAMPGILAAVHVAEGGSVRRGEVVAELANEDLKAKVGQAEAILAVRRAHLELIVLGPRPDEIDKAEAQLQEEAANMTWLRQQFERRQVLFRNGSASLEAFNEISSRLASAEARHKALSHAVSILRQGARPQEINAARAEVLLAENMLGKRVQTLRSPTSEPAEMGPSCVAIGNRARLSPSSLSFPSSRSQISPAWSFALRSMRPTCAPFGSDRPSA